MTAQSRHVLEANSTVLLGNGTVLRASEKLGEGSFGAVWRMDGDNSNFALKETISDSEASFNQTVSEAKLLQSVSIEAGPTQGGTPKYLGHEGVRVGERRWRMRLLMSVVQGEPLDQWMHRSAPAVDFHAASIETRDLLTQMTSTMKLVERFCMHRDISSHNIMVDDSCSPGNPMRARFSLIDFGLAVEKRTWVLRWRDFNLAGDCKYWPPSAWVLFIHGPAGVRQPSADATQYIQGLDVFSLGITALEFLMNRSPTISPLITDLRRVWDDYWSTTGECWEKFYACFKGQGDWEVLRTNLSSCNMACIIMTKLLVLVEEIDRLAISFQDDCILHSLLSTLRYMLKPEKKCTPEFSTVELHLQNNVNLIRYTPQSTFSHVRTSSAYQINKFTQAFAIPLVPVLSNHSEEFKRPVMADFRTPFLPTRQVPLRQGYPLQN